MIARSRWLSFIVILFLCGALVAPSAFASSSINVSLDDWTYDALDRLAGFGLLQSDLKGTRPYTRNEVARLIAEAMRLKAERAAKVSPFADYLLGRLQGEYHDELVRLGDAPGTPPKAFWKPIDELRMGYVYSDGEPRVFDGFPIRPGRIHAYEGAPLVYNNEGIAYGQYNNFTAQISSSANLWDVVSGYIQPIVLARQDEGNFQSFDAAKVDVQKGYAKLSPWDTELEAGRDTLWWGQGAHGTLLMTDNAPPLALVKLDNPSPSLLPWFLQYLGPFKYALFVAQLEENRDFPNTMLAGLRINFKPFPTLELGTTTTFLFNGEGHPSLSFMDLLKLLTFREGTGSTKSKTDGRTTIDFRWRLPFLRNAELYGEYGGEDTGGFERADEIILKDRGYLVGLYFPRVTDDGRLDFRLEYANDSHRVDPTPGYWYGNAVYRSGYTYDGFIIGHHMGPDAEDLFARTTYHVRNDLEIGLDFDYMAVGLTLNPFEQKNYQFATDVTYDFSDSICIKARYGYEQVENFNLEKGLDHQNQMFMTELRWRF
jgi:hypothetical protein